MKRDDVLERGGIEFGRASDHAAAIRMDAVGFAVTSSSSRP